MPRYIDADALLDKQEELLKCVSPHSDIAKRTYQIMVMLQAAPTLSPDEARGVGEWEDAKQHGLCRCSVCKDCYIEKDYITQAKWRYCPNCGARLEASEDA